MTEPAREPLHFVHGTLTLDRLKRKVTAGCKLLELTAREFSFLEFLLAHRGQPQTRDRIAQAIWEADVDFETNLIDVYVLRLRRKLAATGEMTPRIHTIRNVGYMLE